LANVRKLAGSSLIFLALALGVPFLTNISAAKPENSSGVSVGIKRQNLVDPALERALEAHRAFRASRQTVEQGLPSGLPFQGLPQQVQENALGVNLADGVTRQEEIRVLVELFSAKYKVDPRKLRHIVRQESTDNPLATGALGERGYAQFLRSTWEGTPLGEVLGWDVAYYGPANIEMAAWLLRQSESQGKGGLDHWYNSLKDFR